MPTAARLVGALLFAALGYLAAETYKPGMPPETQFGRFVPISALIGLACGWLVMGRLAGRGPRAGMGAGLRTAATMVFYAMILFSVYEMVQRSLRKRYDGVFDAIVGSFDVALVYGAALLNAVPLTLLIVGGMLAGLMVDLVARHSR